MKRIVIAALVAVGTLIAATSCATTDSSQGASSRATSPQGKSNPNASINYPNY
jgi:hypothetical protein